MKYLEIKTLVMDENEVEQWINDNLSLEAKQLIKKGEKLRFQRTPTSITSYQIVEGK